MYALTVAIHLAAIMSVPVELGQQKFEGVRNESPCRSQTGCRLQRQDPC